MITFTLNSLPHRVKNLSLIIPNILDQSDEVNVNLIGYSQDIDLPNILSSDKIVLHRLDKGGSETRFLYYNDHEHSYYFTIDDDILYPSNYADTLVEVMQQYDNQIITCVHGSDINTNLTHNFYNHRKVYHFTRELNEHKQVVIPGVGTSCFHTDSFSVDMNQFKVSNMSDPYISSFAYNQNIPVLSIKRKSNWLQPLNEYGSSIFGNNPMSEIDKLFNKTFV